MCGGRWVLARLHLWCCSVLARPPTLLSVLLQRRLRVLRCERGLRTLGWFVGLCRVRTTGLGGVRLGRSSLLLFRRRGSRCRTCFVGLPLVLCGYERSLSSKVGSQGPWGGCTPAHLPKGWL